MLTIYILTKQYVINIQFFYFIFYKFHTILTLHFVITDQNLKVIAYSYIELWSFKVTHLDVCGSLVLSNSVAIFALQLVKNFLLKVLRVFSYTIL